MGAQNIKIFFKKSIFIGKKSAIQMRQRRRDALQEADVIILAGAVCDFRLSYGRVLGRKAKIIAVSRSKEQLYKVHFFFYGACSSYILNIKI